METNDKYYFDCKSIPRHFQHGKLNGRMNDSADILVVLKYCHRMSRYFIVLEKRWRGDGKHSADIEQDEGNNNKLAK